MATPSSKRRHWFSAALLVVLCLPLLSACIFKTVREQIDEVEASCHVGGQVRSAQNLPGPYVVVLLHRTTAASAASDVNDWSVVDHFVLTGAGEWAFGAMPGHYGVAAFRDVNANLHYDDGEPFRPMDAEQQFDCGNGARPKFDLVIDEQGRPRLDKIKLQMLGMKARSPDEQLAVSLGQLTAHGALATLDDPRFAPDVASASLWRPFDFLRETGGGVYFLEPYDPKKIPVLFVHGINGSPRVFSEVIARLDRTRFQPWVYYYPSGFNLDATADRLTRTMIELELRYRVKKVYVIAHSMGGLVSRGFLLRHEDSHAPAKVPLFITVATPWGGHDAAALGIKTAPVAVPVWHDMAPGSAYLHSLFYSGDADARRKLSADTRHYLLFAYQRKSNSFGESADGVVTVASELVWDAQEEARRLYGYDDTHVGIIANAAALSTIDDLLKSTN